LDYGYSKYNQFVVDLKDQEKVDIPCPFKVFAHIERISFGLKNAPTTFKDACSPLRSSWTIFHLEVLLMNVWITWLLSCKGV